MHSVPFPRIHLLVPTFAALLFALLITGCASAPVPGKSSGPQASSPSGQGDRSASAGQSGQPSPDQSSSDRMVIRTVSMSLVVADVDAVLANITKVVADVQGYVVSSESTESNGNRVGRATLRVPSARLDKTVDLIKGLAQQVPRVTTNAKDVTEEYVDQDARLRNLRASEAQYLEIMKSAQTIEQTLAVQKSLTEVRDQIERTQGRLQYLQRSVEMATISIEITTSAATQPIGTSGYNLLGNVRQAAQALVDVLLFILTLAIWLLVLSPVWLPTYLLFRRWRRNRAKPRSAPPTAPAG